MTSRTLGVCCALALLVLSGCGSTPVCPPETPDPFAAAQQNPSPATGGNPLPTQVKIGSRMILVDRVVEGPLCDDVWSGTIYVGCGVEVPAWEETPTFFEDCNLVIEPGTVVYVADHNDAPYYNGCSCHTGEDLLP